MTGALPWSQLMKDAKENPAADYSPLPAGDYQTQISKVEVTKTKAGEVMFKMQAKVLTGPSMNRITFPNIIVPGPTAKPVRAGYFFNDLKACGITQQFIDSQPQVQQISDALLGKYVIVQLEDAIYNGEKRSNVKRLKPASGAGAPAGGQSGPPPIPGAQQPPQPPQGQPGPPVPQYGAPQPMQGQPQPVQYQPQPQQAPQQYQPQPQAQQPPAAAPQYQPEPQQFQQPPAQQQPPAAAPDTSWPQEPQSAPQQYAPPATPDQAPQQYQQPEQPQQPPQQEQPAQQPQQQQPPQQAPQQPQGQPQFPPSPFGAQ